MLFRSEFAAKSEQAAAIVQPAKQPAASGMKGLPVVKLNDPARVRAKPFVINKVHR